ncbi:unnamed protein product [Linum tenue]|uniref:Uncharacterized protein n=1 Tax=Linum tenue TaxID=586396 RepID=A0AAV0IST8_9ROSI|nr:unnamed protein product [Linum tenue]
MLPGAENPTASAGSTCHVLAMPYPGRGHINPMMNLCRSLSSKHPNILITFVVTEEWLALIGPDHKAAADSDKIRFATVPNVIPSELVRAKDFPGFVKAVTTKLQAPFEMVLDELELELPVNTIIADTYLLWMSEVGNRRGIPVASLWTMSASVFSVFLHFDLLRQHRHYPIEDFSEETVDYIPGLPPTPISDLQPFISEASRQILPVALECISLVSRVQCLLFTSPYEFEPNLFDALKRHFAFSVYPIGPSIPYLKLQADDTIINVQYLQWLDAQPKASVLYVSMGSFLSASKQQTEEIVAGVKNSGVPFLLVSRGDGTIGGGGERRGEGMAVPWCDQLRVLCHDSVGGFWTHCGLNSTLEAVFAGVPMLCWPLAWDQIPNCKSIVDDWKVGRRARKRWVGGGEELVTRDEVADMVRRFMDSENGEVKGMRERASELRGVFRAAVADGGSSDVGLDCFVKDISNQFRAS